MRGARTLQTLDSVFTCPACGGALTRDAARSLWVCEAPVHRFPEAAGLPVLLVNAAAADVTQQAFARQWALQAEGTYESDTIYGETAEAELQSFLDRFGIRSPAELAGRRILDVGCGSGRLTRNLAEWAPEAQVIGGDRSEAARIAHRRCAGLPNVRVAQFDLYAPPFPAASFDFIYADGVIPHVPDAERAVEALDRLLRPGGRMFVWIYPRRFSPYRLLRDVLVRPHALPLAIQRSIEWGIGTPLWMAFKLWEPLRGPRRRSWREVIFQIHDNLAPEFQHRRTPAQMAACFQKLGYADIRTSEPDTGVTATRRGTP